MLNHFWQKIPAFQGITRPKPISKHDPNIFHRAAICRAAIAETTGLGLVDEFRMVSAFARRPATLAERNSRLIILMARNQTTAVARGWHSRCRGVDIDRLLSESTGTLL
jgi:5-methyltetrahydropteroyltriglutamate--homocysteine methyltransferase